MKLLDASAVGLLAWSAAAWTHSDSAELRRALVEDDATLVAFVGRDERALLDEWKAVRGRHVALRTVDCSVSGDVCAEQDVVSFPAIRLYRRNEPMVRYRGPRRAPCITSFLRRMQRPAVTQLTSEAAGDFASSDSVVVIAHEHEGGDASLVARFSSLAAAYRDRYAFGVTLGVGMEASAVQCFNNDDGTQHRQAELDAPGAVEALVAACAEPLIPELSRRTELRYRQSGKSLVYYFSEDMGEREAYAVALRPLAKQLRDYLEFVTVDAGEYPDMARSMGVAGGRGLAVENAHTGQAYAWRRGRGGGVGVVEEGGMRTRPTAQEVEHFITDISQGRAEAWDGRLDGESAGDAGASGHDEL